MSMVRLATLSLLTMFIQQVHCAASPTGAAIQPIVDMTGYTEYKGLVEALFESRLFVKKLAEIMNNARELLLNKDATQAEDLQNVKIIIEHAKVFAMAVKKGKKMGDEIEKMKDADNAFIYLNELNKMTDGEKKNIASEGLEKFIASFSIAGTGTEEKKATARLIIHLLTAQEVRITEEYVLLQKDLTAVEKAQSKSRYDTVIAQIEAAIYEQEIITGDTKSNKTKRDLLLGLVAARKNAIEIIDNAREHLLNKDTTQLEDLQNIKIIIEHHKATLMAAQKLEKIRDEIAKKVEKGIVAEGYWDKFVAGVKNVGAGIVSFFTAGTGTEEEKRRARSIIGWLTFEKRQAADKYLLLQKDLTAVEKAQLKSRYDAVIAQIEVAIYEQQIITGDIKK
jgi:hypothetical protein